MLPGLACGRSCTGRHVFLILLLLNHICGNGTCEWRLTVYWVQDMLAIMFRAEGVGGQVCLLEHVLFWLEGHDRTTKDGIA